MNLIGTLSEVDLPSLVELARQMNYACLRLYSASDTAVIYLQDGEVVHAHCGLQEGEPALLHAFTLRHGIFTVQSNISPPDYTIDSPWNTLLLNGLKRLDDQAAHSKNSSPEDDDLWGFGFGDDDELEGDGGYAVSYHGENMVLSGSITPDDLLEIIGAAQQMSKPSRLQIGTADAQQMLYILDMDVIHAQVGTAVGPEAFYELFTHGRGRFTLEEGIYPQDITINQTWTELLSDAVAYKSEHATNGARTTADVQTHLQLLAERQKPPALGAAVLHLDGHIVAQYGQFDESLATQIALMIHLGRGSKQNLAQLAFILDNTHINVRPYEQPDQYVALRLK